MSSEELYRFAMSRLQQGDLPGAIGALRELSAGHPEHAGVQANLGSALFQTGDVEGAIAANRRAIALAPGMGLAYSNLGMALLAAGKKREAIEAYRSGIRATPLDPNTHFALGNALAQMGDFAGAVAVLEESVRLDPRRAYTHHRLGMALEAMGRIEPAIAAFKQSLNIDSRNIDGWMSLSRCQSRAGRESDAIEAAQRAVDLKPDADTHKCLADRLLESERYDRALLEYEKVSGLEPSRADVRLLLGLCYVQQNAHAAAIAAFDAAIALSPANAIARCNRGMAKLVSGDFAGGWVDFESREVPAAAHVANQPMWDGSDPAGKRILLNYEQGQGDTFQFIRYAAVLKARGAEVYFHCHPNTRRILHRTPGIDWLIARGEAVPPFDVQAQLMSLPGLCRTTLATIPCTVPYIFTDPQLTKSWSQRLGRGRGKRIGLVWQGDPMHSNDRHRSIPLRLFAPLARAVGTELISLQRGPGSEQIDSASADVPLFDTAKLCEAQDDVGGWLDTAAILANLDLLVTVDTAIAHLAGAMGVPVWVALPFVPDWRWLLDRNDSPWYPTMRLFRQPAPGDWAAVIERMAAVCGAGFVG